MANRLIPLPLLRGRRMAALATAALLLAGGTGAQAARPSASASAYPSATISGPVTGGLHGRMYNPSVVNLRPWGYSETEYFASGVASRSPFTAFHTPDARVGPAAYKTRIVVRRPSDPAKFNGTVLVEWFNVTSQQDYDADWSEGYREILRGGYAYVGVSAQQQGVRTMQEWDPKRYGSLRHPGDHYAESIYAQLLRAVRAPHGVNPLAGLNVQHVIADGHSQSGIYLHDFVDRVQSKVHLADGFLVRGDGTTNYDVAHLLTPVLQYQSEAEIGGAIAELQRHSAPTPPAADSTYYRLWQVAGATHTSAEGAHYLFHSLRWDYAGKPVAWDENREGRYDGSGSRGCASSIGLWPLDEFPQWYTLDAAIHALTAWVSSGVVPASAPRIAVTASGGVARDAHGNARGGVRDPVVDVPIATYHGEEGCPLSGVTKPFKAATLAKLYPTRAKYVGAMQAAIARAETAGWLLPYDGADLLTRAQHASV